MGSGIVRRCGDQTNERPNSPLRDIADGVLAIYLNRVRIKSLKPINKSVFQSALNGTESIEVYNELLTIEEKDHTSKFRQIPDRTHFVGKVVIVTNNRRQRGQLLIKAGYRGL